MTPDEQRLSTDLFEGAPVSEVGPAWAAPFQPWADDADACCLFFWAWQRPDTFTPVYNHREVPNGKETA